MQRRGKRKRYALLKEYSRQARDRASPATEIPEKNGSNPEDGFPSFSRASSKRPEAIRSFSPVLCIILMTYGL
jgi:hypothetical protein